MSTAAAPCRYLHQKISNELSLALLANGGTEWNLKNCECDPEANQTCRYCAIHYALLGALNRHLDGSGINPETVKCLEAEIEMRQDWIAAMNCILGYDNSDGFHSSPDPFAIAKRLIADLAELRALMREIEPWTSNHACNLRSESKEADKVYKACVASRRLTA